MEAPPIYDAMAEYRESGSIAEHSEPLLSYIRLPLTQDYTKEDSEGAKGNIDPSKPMIALTFDDGPSLYTKQILDLLEKHDARASFFVMGDLVSTQKGVLRRGLDLGNEFIGHSWSSHRVLTQLSDSEIKSELQRTNNAIKSITGVAPNMHRPPEGEENERVRNVSASLGMSIILWSVDSQDWLHRDADMIYDAIMKDVEDRAIILAHDLYESTAEAMKRVIPSLISQGYQLVTVSELMQYSGIHLEPGQVYRHANPD